MKLVLGMFDGFSHVMVEVAFALIPLMLFFLFFQFIFLKLPWERLRNIFIGMGLTFIGLSLFLQGVHVAFFPVGEVMGQVLGELEYRWIVIPIGFVLGFVATIAEPAVRILNQQVEKASGGYIPSRVLLITLSIGVAVSVALAMVRILYGLPLWAFLIPGYLIALVLTKFSGRTFTAVAFDSGGVATGPMTVTFILALAVGVAQAVDDRNPLIDGFGMVALVALAPIIAVLALGLLYGRKESSEHEPESEREHESEHGSESDSEEKPERNPGEA